MELQGSEKTIIDIQQFGKYVWIGWGTEKEIDNIVSVLERLKYVKQEYIISEYDPMKFYRELKRKIMLQKLKIFWKNILNKIMVNDGK
jgi:hypothetical protein